MTCLICCDDIETNLTLILNYGVKIQSKMCLNCIQTLISKKIDMYLDLVSNETCPNACLRMYKAGLPTWLTVDGSAFGTNVYAYVINGKEHSAKLQSAKSEGELLKIENEFKSVISALENFESENSVLKNDVKDIDTIDLTFPTVDPDTAKLCETVDKYCETVNKFGETVDEFSETTDKICVTTVKFCDTADKFCVTTDKFCDTADKFCDTVDKFKMAVDKLLQNTTKQES
jgi:hypothetical protein